MRIDGQQRVMRLSGAPLGLPVQKPVLTNRMRENFTYGSVGGAGSNPGPYPAPDRRPPRRLPTSLDVPASDSPSRSSSGGGG